MNMDNDMNMDNASLESLRNFALAHNEIAFAHLCTAALEGEVWAVERVDHVLDIIIDNNIVRADGGYCRTKLEVIHNANTTRPDGAVAKGFSDNLAAAFGLPPEHKTCPRTELTDAQLGDATLEQMQIAATRIHETPPDDYEHATWLIARALKLREINAHTPAAIVAWQMASAYLAKHPELTAEQV